MLLVLLTTTRPYIPVFEKLLTTLRFNIVQWKVLQDAISQTHGRVPKYYTTSLMLVYYKHILN